MTTNTQMALGKLRSVRSAWRIGPAFVALGALLSGAREARAQVAVQAPIFLAQIESFTLDPACSGDFCSATLVAGGETVIIPANVLVDLPANRLSARQIFDQAPAACRALRQSGLAVRDTCVGAHPGFVTLAADRTRCGQVIAGDVFIQRGVETFTGTVTFINYAEGWFRVDGIRGDATLGTMVRINDPAQTQTIQTGTGCNGGANCSPDPRFTDDPVNYTASFISGYPLCIPSPIVPRNANGTPSTARQVGANPATGVGDAFCPTTNRPNVAVNPVAADSTRMAPLMVGDNVFVSGSLETVNGVEFLSAHTVQVNVGLMTRNDPTQPDYVQISTMVWDLPSFNLNRVRFRAIGQGTLPGTSPAPNTGTDVDIFAWRVDPRDNTGHLDPLASTFNNPGTNGLGNRPIGPNLWRIDYDVTFPPLVVKPNQPCANLRNAGLLTGAAANKCVNGGTLQEDFSVLSPVSREVFARTRHKSAAIARAANGGPPVPVTRDIVGNAATQGEYTRPLGISLGGLNPPAPLEVDLNLASQPIVLEGLPWLLDRRVGPNGCSAAGCEPLNAFPMGSLAASPFPFSGRSPNQVVTEIALASPNVPVIGRPSTFFEFNAATQRFITATLAVPVDNQCAPGTVRSGRVNGDEPVTVDAAPTAGGGGCSTSGATGRSGGAAMLGLALIGLALAGRRTRRTEP